MSTQWTCVYDDITETVYAETIIEAAMVFYKDYERFPKSISAYEDPREVERLREEVDSLNALVNKRTEERNLAVKKINELFWISKSALKEE